MQLSIQGAIDLHLSLQSWGCVSISYVRNQKDQFLLEKPTLGLIPRLMTKGESAWRKVKIEGSIEKFPSRVFRRCNLGNEKKGPILQLEERPVGSPNSDPVSHVLQVRKDPVPNYRLLPELRYRSRARNSRQWTPTTFHRLERPSLIH